MRTRPNHKHFAYRLTKHVPLVVGLLSIHQVIIQELIFLSLIPAYRVYIDAEGIIYDAALNLTNAGSNNNKFYRIQLLLSASGDYKTWTRWGRVGERGLYSLHGSGNLDSALSHFNAKFKDKSGLTWENRLEPKPTHFLRPKYTFIERQYEVDSSDDKEPIMVCDRSASDY